MRGRTGLEKVVYWLFGDRIPVTKLLIVSNFVTFLMISLFHVGAIIYYLGFSSSQALVMPWSAFTYPLVGIPDILYLLFALYWLWVAGGSLERSWGSWRFGIYFFLMSAVSALGLYVGGLLAGIPVGAVGLWLPLAGATMAFAMNNPEEQILFFLIVPLKLKYLALIDVLIVLVSYGQMNLLLGVFALAGCAASYLYVRLGRRIRFAPSRDRDRGRIIRIYPGPGLGRSLNPIGWYRAYRERKRLKDLFDRSGMGDQ